MVPALAARQPVLCGNIGSAGGRGLRRILGLEFAVEMRWTALIRAYFLEGRFETVSGGSAGWRRLLHVELGFPDGSAFARITRFR
jgi:hypothetical protein